MSDMQSRTAASRDALGGGMVAQCSNGRPAVSLR
jgi:hypothetical protein